jgi:23S rRNA (adenine-C8)-methyltransferase
MELKQELNKMKEKFNPNVTRFDEIERFLSLKGEPDYRFTQVINGIFKERVNDYEKITTLPERLRRELKEKFGPTLSLVPIEEKKSHQTAKVLFELKDGERIEAVKMGYESKKGGWESLCISSQVGCNLGCAFCTTGKIGLKRNLTPDEIIDQPLYFHLQSDNIHSISFMGMGEPLLNPATFTAVKTFTDERLFGFSQRKINISTVGIVPGIKRLTKEFPQINIAFSLHTPFEEQRRELMPIAEQFSIEEIMAILDDHIRKNKRKVFLPYMMLKGTNDTPEHLEALKNLIKNRGKISYLYHVNLIHYNPAPGVEGRFQCSETKTINWFKEELEKAKINVTIRQSFGAEIYAACGQLYAKYKISACT